MLQEHWSSRHITSQYITKRHITSHRDMPHFIAICHITRTVVITYIYHSGVSGMVWYGMAWHAMVSMVWYGVVW